MTREELKYLSRALQIADANITNGGGPFGAVITRHDEVLAESANKVAIMNDPTAHAEMLAIREAAEKKGSFDLSDCVLYASCEPCPMCMGAVYWAGIKKVLYASDRMQAADAGFDDDIIYTELKRLPGDRSILMEKGLEEEGRKVMERWKAFEGKVRY